jgi:DNA-binding beta-propeller fold protein YncE
LDRFLAAADMPRRVAAAALALAAAAAAPTIRTLAGNYPGDGAPATNATLSSPQGLALNAATGALYIADMGFCRVRRVGADGVISTVAGNGACDFSDGGGRATAASLNMPTGVAFYPATGALYVADMLGDRIRRVSATGYIATVAGNGSCAYGGDGGPATRAALCRPHGVAVDPSTGALYVADSLNARVRRVSIATGVITTLAGTGVAGYGGDGGPATSAAINKPYGVAVSGATGVVYIAERDGARVRAVAPDGTITTVAGTGEAGYSGDGHAATLARLWQPGGVGVDPATDALLIADTYNARVRRVAPGTGVITTVVGRGSMGYSGDGGPATDAEIEAPYGVLVEPATGALLLSDSAYGRVRRVAPGTGIIATVAGSSHPGSGGDGHAATRAALFLPYGVAVAPASVGGAQWIADAFNHKIRRVAPNGVITTVAGTGEAGFSGDGGLAVRAMLDHPYGVALHAPSGTLYVADHNNGRLRAVWANGTITTVAGTGEAGFSGDGGPARRASFDGLAAVAVDAAGTLFVVDARNHRVRRVGTNGIVTTVAGSGVAGYAGDGGAATAARLFVPWGVAVDPSTGALLIADSLNARIRRVGTNGVITTLAGTGVTGYDGDGGPATLAALTRPTGVAVDPVSGDVVVCDHDDGRVRVVARNGTITTAAGTGPDKHATGDGGPASAASLRGPWGVAVDGAGVVYVADRDSHRVRAIDGLRSPNPTPSRSGTPSRSRRATASRTRSRTRSRTPTKSRRAPSRSRTRSPSRSHTRKPK